MYINLYITKNFSDKLISSLNHMDDFVLNPKSYSEAKKMIEKYIEMEEKFLQQDSLVVVFSEEYPEKDTLEFVDWIKEVISNDVIIAGRFDWGFIGDNEDFNNKIDDILAKWHEDIWDNVPNQWYEKSY